MMDIVRNIHWCWMPGNMVGRRGITLSSYVGHSWLSICILLTFVHPSLSEGCHQRAMTSCFEQYNSHLQHHIDNQDQHFYSGIDVEVLRTICHSMKAAVGCTMRKCPGLSQESLLEVLPSDVTNMIDLCSPPEIYEVYARNRFCFSDSEQSLQSCHDDYAAATLHLVDSINTENSPGVQPMCSEFSKLVECIEESVASICNAEATSLVELLVRPSIQYSQFCPKKSAVTTAPPTTTMVPTRSHYRYREEPSENIQEDLENELSETGSHNKGVSSHTSSVILVTSVLTLLFTILLHLV